MHTHRTIKKTMALSTVLVVLLYALLPQPAAADTVVEGLTAQAFKDAIDRHRNDPDMVLLDIRTPGEFNAGHIQGARMIDYYSPDYVDRLKALDRQKTYLIYCRSGNRTGRSLAIFQRLGFTRVYHLESGLIGWLGEKYPLITTSAS